ncbi:MAG: sulfurtransferase TusA family protein [Alphaproteobacteria bacterium]
MARILDARGLLCPEPVLRTRKAMLAVSPGETLTVLATDPAATIDFPYYCHHARMELLAARKEAGTLVFEIRKPAKAAPLAAKRPIA